MPNIDVTDKEYAEFIEKRLATQARFPKNAAECAELTLKDWDYDAKTKLACCLDAASRASAFVAMLESEAFKLYQQLGSKQ